jgi:hypothetical protein
VSLEVRMDQLTGLISYELMGTIVSRDGMVWMSAYSAKLAEAVRVPVSDRRTAARDGLSYLQSSFVQLFGLLRGRASASGGSRERLRTSPYASQAPTHPGLPGPAAAGWAGSGHTHPCHSHAVQSDPVGQPKSRRLMAGVGGGE